MEEKKEKKNKKNEKHKNAPKAYWALQETSGSFAKRMCKR